MDRRVEQANIYHSTQGDVKITFLFLPKRECKNVFVNINNLRIPQDDPSNQDIQILAKA